MNDKLPKKPVQIYQLKITLSEIYPPIFRILQIKSNASLDKLHDYVQGVMGWTNSHLHEFLIKGRVFQDVSHIYEPQEPDVLNERRHRLNNLVKEGETFKYIYDFGDDWTHEITLEKVIEPSPGVYYPICIYGERSCPPEDSGGTMGYEQLLEIINDQNHEDHQQYLEWVGEGFDPDKFDLEEVNEVLDIIKSKIRETRI
jgi:hypothetical protein